MLLTKVGYIGLQAAGADGRCKFTYLLPREVRAAAAERRQLQAEMSRLKTELGQVDLHSALSRVAIHGDTAGRGAIVDMAGDILREDTQGQECLFNVTGRSDMDYTADIEREM